MRQPAPMLDNPRPDVLTDAFIAMLAQGGVTAAWLFGSVSRGEERPESDIDLLVEFDHDITFFERSRLADRLSHLAGRQVDLLVDIDPVFDPYIRPTLIPIPL